MKLSRVIVATSIALVLSCSDEATEPVGVGPVGVGTDGNVATVTIVPAELALVPSEESFLSVIVNDGAGNPIMGMPIQWSSSDESVVAVNTEGRLTALSEGQAEVRALVGSVTGVASVFVSAFRISQDVVVIDSTLARLRDPISAAQTGLYEFDLVGSPAPNIRPGSVIVGAQAGGFLARATAVDRVGNRVSVSTSVAGLNDILDAGVIRLSPPSGNTVLGLKAAAEITFKDPEGTASGGWEMTQDGRTFRKVSLNLAGICEIGAGINTAEVKNLNVGIGPTPPELIIDKPPGGIAKVTLVFDASVRASGDPTLVANGKVKCEVKEPVGRLIWRWLVAIPIPVPPFALPIWGAVVGTITVGGVTQVEGEVALSGHIDETIGIRIGWENEAFVLDSERKMGNTHMDFEEATQLKLTLSVFAQPQVAASVYNSPLFPPEGLPGAALWLKGDLTASVNGRATFDAKSCPHQIDVTFDSTVEIEAIGVFTAKANPFMAGPWIVHGPEDPCVELFEVQVEGDPTGDGSGRVVSSPPGISCTISPEVVEGTCRHMFPDWAQVSLTATAEPGSRFAGWIAGACGGQGRACSLMVDKDLMTRVRFERVKELVSGTVTLDGLPKEGVFVDFVRLQVSALPLSPSRTDANGHYLREVDPGDYIVKVNNLRFFPLAVCNPESKQVRLERGESVTVDFDCSSVKGAIHGTVTLDNEPAAGAEVLIFPAGGQIALWSAITDDTGFYQIELDAGDYEVRVTPPVPQSNCEPPARGGMLAVGEIKRADFACTTKTAELSVQHSDGVVTNDGIYDATAEEFDVDTEVFYRILVTNTSGSVTATSVNALNTLTPGLFFQEIREGFPTRGLVTTTGTGGFAWTIGSLGPGESAEIQFSAVGILPGNESNTFTLTANELAGSVISQEPTVIK